MAARTTIALLVRQERHLTEALRTGRALEPTGARVTLFLLSGPALDPSAEGLQVPVKIQSNRIHGYTDDPGAADRLSLACMSIDEMAQLIQKADVVIPF
jgi:hypothetical protein